MSEQRNFDLSKHQMFALARMLEPHQPKEIRIVNMPPRSGKTTLAVDLIQNAKADGKTTLYMPESDPVAKMYAPADRNIGFGGALTGHAYDLIVLDDPVGFGVNWILNHRDDTIERVGSYLPHVRNHLKPGGLLVLLETRQDEDDATGWFKRHTENLTHVVIPAIISGESFFPELWPTEQLRRIEREVGPKIWGTMYLQQPSEAAA